MKKERVRSARPASTPRLSPSPVRAPVVGVEIGTSGWVYPHWRGRFYPADLPVREQLAYYAERFGSVEINSSFYRLPTTEAVRSWVSAVPSSFVFAVKGSRFITHMKKLSDPEGAFSRFFDRIRDLGPRMGPILFQLPPHWRYNGERLRRFVASLPKGRRYAFEFREPSWFNPDAERVLREANAAVCRFHLAGYVSPPVETADFAYIRLHGPGGKYQGSYSDADLSGWADEVARQRDAERAVYVYFDNDQDGFAASDAGRLVRLVRGGAASGRAPVVNRRRIPTSR